MISTTPRLTVPFVEIKNRDKIEVLMLKGEDYHGDHTYNKRKQNGRVPNSSAG